MKSQKEILRIVKEGRDSKCLDGRDYSRLADFFPVEDWDVFGFELKEGASHEPKIWTRENILKKVQDDVSFGFEKALNRRGISSGFMYEVVKMWLWVLNDEELMNFDDYPMYGLPLFKAVAIKYGFNNPIGDDTGSEEEYDDYYDYED